MSFIRAQVELARTTGLPEDKVVNTLYFDTDVPVLPDSDETAAIQAKVFAFYNAISQYLSTLITGALTLKLYDLEDPEPRSPIHEAATALVGMQAADYPAEIAICASFAADKVSGEAQRRRRGRIYIGPTNSTTRGAIVQGDVTVLASARVNILNAMQTLADSPSQKWAVFSPTEAGAPAGGAGAYTAAQLGPAFNDVTNGWVDDRYDIQRRRGAKSTVRSAFGTP